MIEDAAEQEEVSLAGKIVMASFQLDFAAPHHDPGYQTICPLGCYTPDAGNPFLVGKESLGFAGVFEQIKVQKRL